MTLEDIKKDALVKLDMTVPSHIAMNYELRNFIEIIIDETAQKTMEAVMPEGFMPPIKFEIDFTTKAWNLCRDKVHSLYQQFIGKK